MSEMLWCVFQEWESDVDCHPLIALLPAEADAERLRETLEDGTGASGAGTCIHIEDWWVIGEGRRVVWAVSRLQPPGPCVELSSVHATEESAREWVKGRTGFRIEPRQMVS